MPYTRNSPERPRSKQIECPQNEGEFTLAITNESLKFLKEQTESFKTHSRILSALRGMPMYAVNLYLNHPSSIKHLQNNFSYYAKLSKLSDEALRGCYEAAIHEWYRRSTAYYEDQKCLENGDVYATVKVESGLNARITALEVQIQILLNAVKIDVPHIKIKKENI